MFFISLLYSFLDLIWMPTFNFNSKNILEYKEKLISGWDTLLIQKRLPSREWRAGVRVLVLTGGSDTTKLGKNLPTILDGMLRSDCVIDWVQGPFSESPNIPSKCRLTWNVHNAPSQLDDLDGDGNAKELFFVIDLEYLLLAQMLLF